MVKYKLPCILAAISLVRASTIKGLSPDKYDLYQPSSQNTWTCLDGSKIIPYKAINDDYCDCPDGSDEPGTSACPNAFFYCANEGHVPAYIKSYAVNDGVCDEACCDGSDENGDLISCPDRCQHVGEVYRKQQASLKQSVEAGLKAKQQLVDEAEKQVSAWEEDETRLQDEIVLKKSNLLKIQRELETLESRVHKTKKRACQSSVIEIATLKHDITILQKELTILSQILGDMKRDHNHNYHDMAVKSAIAGYDEFVARYATIEPEIEEDLKSIDVKEEEEEEEEEEEDELETKENAPEDNEVKGKHTLLDSILETLDSVLPNTFNVLDKLLPKTRESSNNGSKEAVLEQTRQQVQDAEKELNELNTQLDKVKANLAFDYGKDKEWLKLKDVCIEKDEGEYTYSLCFLGSAHQKSNKDSTRTYLGQFEKFDGPEENVYKVHAHTHGTRCWNGPERSVRATIECGVKNEIIEVSEPEKCEYHFRLLSPAVCQPVIVEQQQHINKKPIHEEL